MYSAFCYACKTHVTTIDKETFTRSGHVSTKDEAWNKYHVATNQLNRDVVVGR